MIWNTVLLALRAIYRNPMRASLTILGVVIGVAAVITMVTLGNGATQSVGDQIAKMGTHLLMVVPGQRLGPGGGGAPAFRVADAEAIEREIGTARAVAPVVGAPATVVREARNWSTTVTGTHPAYLDAGNWTLAAGRGFTEAEQRAGKAVCVIGESVRAALFDQQDPVGSTIRVAGFACEVIGLLAPKGQSAMGSDQDDTIIMPLRTVQRRLRGSLDVDRVMVAAVDQDVIDATRARLESLLRERRRIGAGEDDDFRVMDTRQLAETLTGTTKVLTMLLAAVAAVSLLVGGIGIMNIMLVSVTERTREIGIRLAIGALEREVLLQFLIEAMALSGLGGLVGLALAAAASIGIAGLMGVPYGFDPTINLVAFGFSVAIGVVFGYFPARRAARLDPIDALRHE